MATVDVKLVDEASTKKAPDIGTKTSSWRCAISSRYRFVPQFQWPRGVVYFSVIDDEGNGTLRSEAHVSALFAAMDLLSSCTTMRFENYSSYERRDESAFLHPKPFDFVRFFSSAKTYSNPPAPSSAAPTTPPSSTPSPQESTAPTFPPSVHANSNGVDAVKVDVADGKQLSPPFVAGPPQIETSNQERFDPSDLSREWFPAFIGRDPNVDPPIEAMELLLMISGAMTEKQILGRRLVVPTGFQHIVMPDEVLVLQSLYGGKHAEYVSRPSVVF